MRPKGRRKSRLIARLQACYIPRQMLLSVIVKARALLLIADAHINCNYIAYDTAFVVQLQSH